MANQIGISGSTILTDSEKFELLFSKEHVEHIEIGEFPNKESFYTFLEQLHNNNLSFGLHSPLYRNESKYDLLEKVQYEPKEAWKQFESEVK